MTTSSLRSLLLATATALLLLTGCDSDDASDPQEATVRFGTDVLSAVGPEESPVELPVILGSAIAEPLTVEVLLAVNASDNVNVSDFAVDTPDDERAYYGDDGNISGYVVGSTTFPAGAEAGATQSVAVDLDEDLPVDRKVAVFALQTGGDRDGRSRVRFESPRTLTLTLNVITLLDAGFSEGDFPAPLTAFDAGGSANWGASSRSDVASSPYAQANAFGASAPSNDWLISPAFDFTAPGTKTLTFRNAKNFDDGGVSGEALNLLVSTNYDGEGNPEEADWTDISERVTYSGGGYEFVSSGPIDLSDDDFQSDETYVALQYISSGTGGGSSELWRVDDIRLTRSRAAAAE